MDSTDGEAPHVWLSYPEAAAALGVSVRAVEGRAYRGRWGKQKGNDGTVRLAVPRGELDPTRRGGDGSSDPMHGATRGSLHGPTEAPAINVLLDELKATHERLAGELRQRAETAEVRAERAEQAAREASEALGVARGEGATLQRILAHEQERAARLEAERDAIRAEFGAWTSGGPLARAWRAFLNRQR